jgi:hypothetical protein
MSLKDLKELIEVIKMVGMPVVVAVGAEALLLIGYYTVFGVSVPITPSVVIPALVTSALVKFFLLMYADLPNRKKHAEIVAFLGKLKMELLTKFGIIVSNELDINAPCRPADRGGVPLLTDHKPPENTT